MKKVERSGLSERHSGLGGRAKTRPWWRRRRVPVEKEESGRGRGEEVDEDAREWGVSGGGEARSLIPSPGRRRRGGWMATGARALSRPVGGTARGRGAGSWAGLLWWAEAHGKARG